jgi:hypothetical protein
MYVKSGPNCVNDHTSGWLAGWLKDRQTDKETYSELMLSLQKMQILSSRFLL